MSLLRQPRPSIEIPLTAAEITANRRAFLLHVISIAAVAISILALAEYGYDLLVVEARQPGSIWQGPAGGFVAGARFLWLITALFGGVALFYVSLEAMETTGRTQIKGQACIDLGDLAGKHPEIRRYVDTVVEQGRPLLNWDLQAARVFAEKEEEAVFRARAEAACKALHRAPSAAD